MRIYPSDLHASQQPVWPDSESLNNAIGTLEEAAPLTTPRITDKLTQQLARAAEGEAFVLQAGPCAESLLDTPEDTEKLVETILPMTLPIMFGAGVPVVKIGRVAGQFGKPRSSDTEKKDDIELPSFRGEIVNDPEFTVEARTPDPERMLRVYRHSAGTLKVLNDLATGGFADLDNINQWNTEFILSLSLADQAKFFRTMDGIRKAISFMHSTGIDTANVPHIHQAEIFTSHEALILDYESALTRLDERTKQYYGSSAHMLWIGERTRSLYEAHVAFCAGIANPIGAKLGPTATSEEVLGLCEAINPDRTPGRLSFIARMGANKIEEALPGLIESAKAEGYPITWMSDPMHGNTISTEEGIKTREFDAISLEVERFFGVCSASGVFPGGVHLEMSGSNVTECVGGSGSAEVRDLSSRYTTNCDPRLNSAQGIQLALNISDLLQKARLAR